MEQKELFEPEVVEEKDNKAKEHNNGKRKAYSNPLLPTSQFVMCGNCFRADMYKGCGFGCDYCFANNRGGKFERDFQVANVDLIRKWFKEAIEDGDTSNIKKECLNHKVPIHLGGLSDPFQKCEQKYRASYRFLEISKYYNYPVNISTKTSHLDDMYWEILDPKIHTFSISILGYTDEYVRTWESATPLATERINFVKELKERGFWVSIRIQPIIVMEEVEKLIKASDKYVDYYTIEHLKLPVDNAKARDRLLGKMHGVKTCLVAKGREYEFDSTTKRKNIEYIKSLTNVKIGCGDNDFHFLSDSLNCCGIDTMPPSFSNWLKYNTMYIKMTGDRTQWSPSSNCNECWNGSCVIKGFTTMKQYTDKAYIKQYGHPDQMLLDL
jgi:DNA repair photolyase